MKSAGSELISSPKKAFICDEKIIKAIPLVNPTIKEQGIEYEEKTENS